MSEADCGTVLASGLLIVAVGLSTFVVGLGFAVQMSRQARMSRRLAIGVGLFLAVASVAFLIV